MQFWTLAYHNRAGTGAAIFLSEFAAYQALITMIVDPSDSQAMLIARKLLFLAQFEELCAYLQKNHFGELDDYRIQAHNLSFAAVVPEGK